MIWLATWLMNFQNCKELLDLNTYFMRVNPEMYALVFWSITNLEELQILFAAVFEEVDHFRIALHGLDDLGRRQGAAAVLVD